ncbi:hypothetical protein A1353_08650 [Methylomonas methanica]|uniref:Uncharacterized protein n=1 Tax=Methylomonas methanica TaxID=421 RepID=A0A177ML36_METMH|nr:hypothetical protein A1353_08650 [Methylomonas methanica]
MPWIVAMRQYLASIDTFMQLRFLGAGNCQMAVVGNSGNRRANLAINPKLKHRFPKVVVVKANTEPSTFGRGQGEGMQINALYPPHPNPLPRGEGAFTTADAGGRPLAWMRSVVYLPHFRGNDSFRESKSQVK